MVPGDEKITLEKNPSIMGAVAQTTHQTNEQIHSLLLVAMATSLFTFFINYNSTALTWPAIDNLPAVCRLLDSTCLKNDFFTNASSQLNPRSPYIYLVGAVTYVSGNGLGGGLSIIKSLLLALLPIALVMTLVTACSRMVNHGGPTALLQEQLVLITASLSVILLQTKLGALLSVAWWPPVYFDATPQNVSLLVALMGMLIIANYRHNNPIKYIGAVLLFFSGALHPVTAFFSFVFTYLLFTTNPHKPNKENIDLFRYGLAPCLLAAILVSALTAKTSTLSASDFIRIYIIEAHPEHYLPSQFGSLSQVAWQQSFFTVVLGLILISFILFKQGSPFWRNSFASALAYAISIAAQYSIEIWPLKIVAMIGPSRFTMFGPWFFTAFSTVAAINLISKHQASNIIIPLSKGKVLLPVTALATLVTASFYALTSHQPKLNNHDVNLFNFIKTGSHIDDVIVMPHNSPRAFLPLITRRAIFFGNGFPFNESAFTEYLRRKSLVDGDHEAISRTPGSWSGEKYSNFYRSQTPADFIKMSETYRLDWVVLESDYSKAFRTCKPRYTSEMYVAFDIPTLRVCANNQLR